MPYSKQQMFEGYTIWYLILKQFNLNNNKKKTDKEIFLRRVIFFWDCNNIALKHSLGFDTLKPHEAG